MLTATLRQHVLGGSGPPHTPTPSTKLGFRSPIPDLVVVKAAIVDEELAKLGMKFAKGRTSRRTVSEDAFTSGHAAGKKVVLNPGIGARDHFKEI